MLQVAPRMEASDLLDGLGQGVDQAAGWVGSLGKHSGAELADEPRGAVPTPGAGAIRGAEPIEDADQGEEEAVEAEPVVGVAS